MTADNPALRETRPAPTACTCKPTDADYNEDQHGKNCELYKFLTKRPAKPDFKKIEQQMADYERGPNQGKEPKPETRPEAQPPSQKKHECLRGPSHNWKCSCGAEGTGSEEWEKHYMSTLKNPVIHHHTDSCFSDVPETEGKGIYLRCQKVQGKAYEAEPAAQREASVAPPQEVLCSLCDKPANSFTLLCDYCDPRSSINSPYAEASVAEQPTPQPLDQVNEILGRWIRDANEGRIKMGKRELTNDELALIGDTLRCVAGDISLLKSGAGR